MSFNAAFHIYPSEIHDVWVAHCLTLDIATQGEAGKGPESAYRALAEAVSMCVRDDWSDRVNPLERGPAPREDWTDFERAFERAEPEWSVNDENVQSVVGWFVVDENRLPALPALIIGRERKQ